MAKNRTRNRNRITNVANEQARAYAYGTLFDSNPVQRYPIKSPLDPRAFTIVDEWSKYSSSVAKQYLRPQSQSQSQSQDKLSFQRTMAPDEVKSEAEFWYTGKSGEVYVTRDGWCRARATLRPMVSHIGGWAQVVGPNWGGWYYEVRNNGHPDNPILTQGSLDCISIEDAERALATILILDEVI